MPSPDPGGALFVIDGDLTGLHCDAILVPVDKNLSLTGLWSELKLGDVRGDARPPDGWGSSVRSFEYRAGPGPRVWLGEIGRANADDSSYAAGLVDFVERASQAIPRPEGGRLLRLAVNVAGSGAGGSEHDKGRLFETIIPELTKAARSNGVDVVLVCWGAKPFAAAQRSRERLLVSSPSTSDADPTDEHVIRLAQAARDDRLVLFIGAGVSQGAGLPSWDNLLDSLVDRLDSPALDRERLSTLDIRDQALLVRKKFPSEAAYLRALSSCFDADHYSLTHGLLASLGARECVTTNYDELYEDAVRTAGRTCAVLPQEPFTDQDRWLLKLHGTISQPKSIVLTRHDYLGLPANAGALFSLLQAMLFTRHMLFVGYSLTDDSFHKVMHEVREARRNHDDSQEKVGTALVLFRDEMLEELWGDLLHIVPMMDPPAESKPTSDEVSVAARQVETFLDRVNLLATDVSAFLLDPTYASMLDDEERQIAEQLHLAASVINPGTGPIAESLRTQLTRLGWEPDRADHARR